MRFVGMTTYLMLAIVHSPLLRDSTKSGGVEAVEAKPFEADKTKKWGRHVRQRDLRPLQWATRDNDPAALPLVEAVPAATCDRALRKLCQTHVSCRELWRVYRRACAVDLALNRCQMHSPRDCWQSFEGLSWTGLGACTCLSPAANNSDTASGTGIDFEEISTSDCHWIRLQTRFNKCIYELQANSSLRSQDSYYALSSSRAAASSAPISPPPRSKVIPLIYTTPSSRLLSTTSHAQRQQSPAQRMHFATPTTTTTPWAAAASASAPTDRKQHIRPIDATTPKPAANQHHPLAHRQQPASFLSTTTTNPESAQQQQPQQRFPQWQSRRKINDNEVEGGKKEANDDKNAEEVRSESFRRRNQQQPSPPLSQPHRDAAAAAGSPSLPPPFVEFSTTTTIVADHAAAAAPSIVFFKLLHDAQQQQPQQAATEGAVGFGPLKKATPRNAAETAEQKTTTPTTSSSSSQPNHFDSFTTSAMLPFPLTTTARTNLAQFSYSGDDDDDDAIESRRKTLSLSLPSTTTTPTTLQRFAVAQTHFVEATKQTRAGSFKHTENGNNQTLSEQRRLVVDDDENDTRDIGVNEKDSSTTPDIDASEEEEEGEETQKRFRPLAQALNAKHVTKSTCEAALVECERDEACRWHLAELREHCPSIGGAGHRNSCAIATQRDACAKALARFTRYVSGAIVEPLMFCQCTANDRGCLNVQRLMYPPCLHSLVESQRGGGGTRSATKHRWSCVQTARLCHADIVCRRHLAAYQKHCSTAFLVLGASATNTSATATTQNRAVQQLDESVCTSTDFHRCRQAIMNARGGWLEQQCHCDANKVPPTRETRAECDLWAQNALPNHPCVAASIFDYNSETRGGAKNRSTLAPRKSVVATTSANTQKTSTPLKSRLKTTKLKTTTTQSSEKEGPSLGDFVTLLPGAYETEGEEEEGEDEVKTSHSPPPSPQTNASLLKSPVNITAATNLTMKSTKNSDELDADNKSSKKKKNASSPRQKSSSSLDNASSHELRSVNGERFAVVNNGNNTTILLSDEKEKQTHIKQQPAIAPSVASSRLPPPGIVSLGGKSIEDEAAKKTEYFQPPSLESEAEDGCVVRAPNGEPVVHRPDTVFRRFHDWSGRCSDWCECAPEGERVSCRALGCLSDLRCETRQTTIDFGEKLYLNGRGACLCHAGRFVCDGSPRLGAKLAPGVYATLGYSRPELELIRAQVHSAALERAGLVSPPTAFESDLASRLQIALERLLPKGVMCRLVVEEHFAKDAVILLRLQWYGVDPFASGGGVLGAAGVHNQTKSAQKQTTAAVVEQQKQPRARWLTGRMEKQCAGAARLLEEQFVLDRAERLQLVLSTVKQLRVLDLLDDLPTSISAVNSVFSPFSWRYYLFWWALMMFLAPKITAY